MLKNGESNQKLDIQSLKQNIEIKQDVDLKKFCTFHIGGNAKFMAFPKNNEGVRRVINFAQQNHLHYFILGNGSNVLFADKGFDGVVINMKYLNHIKITRNNKFLVDVGAGVNLYKLHYFLCKNELSGLEWSFGIPASIGGFVYMNGGCFSHDISQNVEGVTVLKDNQIINLSRNELEFSYRSSNLQNCVILSVKLSLFHGKSDEIKQNQEYYYNLKKNSQPIDFPSAGSIFKNPKDKFVAKMIDNAGLKGVKIGGAEISTKHANFIINIGDAKASDVLSLIDLVCKKLGQKLDTEIKIIK